jgi:hypothetical protein
MSFREIRLPRSDIAAGRCAKSSRALQSDNLKPLWMKNHRFLKVLDGQHVHGAGGEGGHNSASQG